MAYQAFPIYDLRQGKITDRDPWLLPADAFQTLKNCHLRYGVLEKRRGYVEFGQLVHVDTSTKEPTLVATPVMGIYNYYSGATKQLIVMSSARLNKFVISASTGKTISAFADATGGEVQVTATGHGFVTDNIVTISETTNYNGTYNVTKVDNDNFKITATWVEDDATGIASQNKFIDVTRNKIRFKHASKQNWQPLPNNTVKGAISEATADVESVIVDTGTFAGNDANGTIIFKNGTISAPFEDGEELQKSGTSANKIGDADGANTDDEFTGDYTNFFWIENWNAISYVTNNNDIIQKFNGNYLTRFHIDLDVEGGPDNDVTRARFIFFVKDRLLILDTTERGTNYRQRARWCGVKAPHIWKDADYRDASTNEWIIAADIIGEEIIVWLEASTWKISYTSDPDIPFRWDRIDNMKGSAAPMSIIPFGKELYTVSNTEIIGTNARDIYAIDKKIPNFMLEWLPESVAYCFGFVLEEERQSWITFTSLAASAYGDGNTYSDSVLILNSDDNSFSTYKLPAHVLGSSLLESDLTWETDLSWEDIDFSWEEKSTISGFPTTLMGCRDGKIYQLNTGGSDNGSAIEFQVIGGDWNPFLTQDNPQKARLGWIDFLVDVDPSVSFDVKNYLDTNPSPFQTKTLTCSTVEGSSGKVWHRIYVNAIARFHRLKLYNNAITNRPRIHAIVPHFEPAGKII